jgi:hypothetical protein
MMSKKIKFIAVHDYAWDVADKPYPAKNNIPEWWKKMSPFIPDKDNPEGKLLSIRNMRNNLSPKKCMPMLDAITGGYIIPLWCDVQVTNTAEDKEKEYLPVIYWKATKEVFEDNIDGSFMLEIPEGYDKMIFKFINLWCIKTPPGYSVRISAPIANNDSPFRAFDAVVDTDKYDALPIPMLLKEGFEGLIPRGTPMIQVVPFKREGWESEFDYYAYGVHDNKQESWLRLNSFGNYIKTQWSKKIYK